MLHRIKLNRVATARALVLGLALLAATAWGPGGQGMTSNANAPDFSRWAAMVVAGDWRANTGNPTEAFENARRDVSTALTQLGFRRENIRTFSVRPPDGEDNVGQVTGPRSLESVLLPITRRAPEGCLIYMTSHGNLQGLALDEALMTVSQMRKMVRTNCGDRPTILIVSACHSGIFAREELQSPNRMILTAALPERVSFGCGESNRYPFFDECFLESIPEAEDFLDLAERTRTCVANKEKALNLQPSEPQLVVGERIEALLRAGTFDPDGVR